MQRLAMLDTAVLRAAVLGDGVCVFVLIVVWVLLCGLKEKVKSEMPLQRSDRSNPTTLQPEACKTTCDRAAHQGDVIGGEMWIGFVRFRHWPRAAVGVRPVRE